MTETKKRGGSRPGAGRKALPKDEVRVITTITIDPDTKRKLQSLRKVGFSLGREVDRMVSERYLDFQK